MKAYSFPLLSTKSITQSALIEAKLRRNPQIVSAICKNTELKVYVKDNLNLMQTTLLLTKTLGSDVIKISQEFLGSAKNLAPSNITKKPTPANTQSNDEISKQVSFHKKSAIISLAALGFFEILKRVNPTFYASTTILRHLTVLGIGASLFKEGILGAIKERRPNAETLTCTAVLASIVAGKPESSLSLLALSNFAETLTIMAAQKARQNIRDLVGLNVQEVWVKREDGSEVKVHIDEVKPGMIVSIHSGEKICIDGEVQEGTATVDQAAITGESIPVMKNVGDLVYAGSNIRLGEIEVKVLKVGDDTSLSRIVHMVENAQNRRAPIQHYADKMATSLVPVSFIAALVVYLATRDLQRVLNMLFIDFSCGLKLSTATAMSAAISCAARQGILVKGGSFIESAAQIDTIILDKTGTITRGRPSITKITCNDGFDETTVLKLAAATEVHSTHPMALAILDAVKERKLEIPRHLDTKTIIARGIEGDICPFEGCPGGKTYVGSLTLMHEMGIQDLELAVEKQSPVGSLIYVAFAGVLAGVIEVSDPIRDQFKRSVNRLRHLGVEEIVMLTGDNESAAASIAQSLALDDYKAQVLPEDKAKYVANRQGNCNVLMVGDGINDAPALAYADIGVAMGTGCTDTALETADVTINSEDPLKLPEFISISRDTMHLVHQNFAVTILVNTAAMMLGALGVINPLVASVIHNASTLGVVVNSGRVLVSHKKNA